MRKAKASEQASTVKRILQRVAAQVQADTRFVGRAIKDIEVEVKFRVEAR